MSEAQVHLTVEGLETAFRPRDELRGQFTVEGANLDELQAVEISVLWHTEGKGDEDISVHSFERIEATSDEPLDLRRPRRFHTVLPNSPMSYEGSIVKIRWCARVRVFMERGKELCAEATFRLGSVPVPEEVAT